MCWGNFPNDWQKTMADRARPISADPDYEKLSKREFLDAVAELRDTLEAELSALQDDFERTASAKKKRLAKAGDLLFFARTYFPHYIRPKVVDGKEVPVEPAKLHHWFAGELVSMLKDEDSINIAVAAARGDAKSTYCLILLLYVICHSLKHFMINISDILDVAAIAVEGVKVELESNPRLAYDFPDVVGQGRVWRAGEIVTRNKIKLLAKGVGGRLRGLRHGARRPDLILLDDIENDENVESPMQRDKRTSWLNKAVDNLGEAGAKCDTVYVGTILHFDSTLKRTMDNPVWTSRVFPAIERMPDRADLWDQWEEVFRADGMAAAREFYRAHQVAMGKGAVLSWPDKRSLLELMEKKLKSGDDAFASEYQQSPLPKDAMFKALTFWVDRLAGWQFFASCDPSLGKKGQGRDPSALLVGGINREDGRLDVVEADIRRRVPSLIIDRMILLQQEFNCIAWFVESVQFQEFFRTQAMKEAATRHVPMPCFPVNPVADKELRIQRLEPAIRDGLIRLHASQKTLIDQLKQFPKADHDDGPDALEMLWTGATAFTSPADIRSVSRPPTSSYFGGY